MGCHTQPAIVHIVHVLQKLHFFQFFNFFYNLHDLLPKKNTPFYRNLFLDFFNNLNDLQQETKITRIYRKKNGTT